MTTGYRYGIRQRPPMLARQLTSPLPERLGQMLANAAAGVSEPFRGITTTGSVVPGLFSLQRTGVSTRPIKDAATAFLASLSGEQRAAATFAVDSDAWRRWNNTHIFLMRHGALLEELTPAQRDAAFGVLRASLSDRGFETARDIMRLNETLAEVTGSRLEYGEWLYWLSILGTPAADQPWGWQIDGHHLVINCFILGDQVVMTPTFMGSEPVYAESGKYAGTRVLAAEEQNGLEFIQSLSPEQRARARPLERSHPVDGRLQAGAFVDNIQIGYEGISAAELRPGQRELLLRLIETYVGHMRSGHDEVKMAEVRQHLDATRLAWVGGAEADSVFYYRVHSPVVLIEFDHQRGIAFENDEPSRNHIHTVVRTPNGNDYGKDLLRQHYERHHAGQRPGGD